jgi:hypothetical protein
VNEATIATRPGRRWFRFGLRTLFVVVTVLCCYLAWETSVVRHRQKALREMQTLGGFQIVTAAAYDQQFRGTPIGAPPAKVSLIRRLLGDQAIQEIWVHWYNKPADAEIQRFARTFPEAKLQESLAEPCHPGCFPTGTMVETLSGLRRIETIREGDFITTIDADGDETSAQVQSIFITDNRLWQVDTDAGSLVTTQTQPLYVGAGENVQVGDLHAGDTIFRWQDGVAHSVNVRAVSSTSRVEKVYNLILGNSQVFVAGGFLARSKPPKEALP